MNSTLRNPSPTFHAKKWARSMPNKTPKGQNLPWQQALAARMIPGAQNTVANEAAERTEKRLMHAGLSPAAAAAAGARVRSLGIRQATDDAMSFWKGYTALGDKFHKRAQELDSSSSGGAFAKGFLG